MNTKEMLWSFFERTGSIEAFLEYNQVKGITLGETNEKDSDKGIGN